MNKSIILIFSILFIAGFSITARSQCSGTPAPGTIYATQSSGCTTYSTILSLTGAGSGTGITYQWDSSTDGSTFFPIDGATNDNYTTTITADRYFTCTVSCSFSSSFATTPVAVMAITPVAPITGATTACEGFTLNLHDATPGGTWSSSDPSVASVNPTTGVVSGIMPGGAVITYTAPGACTVTAGVAVNTIPSVFGGSPSVCEGSATTLTDSIAGGTWTSSNTTVATIDPSTGYVNGLVAGNTTITYTLVTGCYNLIQVTVNPLPALITSPGVVCEGNTILLGDTTPFGTWSSTAPAHATVDASIGVVTGVLAGTSTISYTISATSCARSTVVTINPSPTAITGPANACLGATTTLADTYAGGVWSSTISSVATVTPTGGVVTGITSGTSTISYVLPLTGCSATLIITVNPLPTIYNVTGGGSYCAGSTGVHIGLDGSDIGTSYVLDYGSAATGFVSGTGTAIDFGLLTVTGTYHVSATSIITGCMNAMADSAVVNIAPLFTPSVSILASPGDTVCPGTFSSYTPVAINAGSSPTYLWKVNGMSVSTASTYDFIPAAGDIISLQLTADTACATPDTVTSTIAITVLPSVSPSVDISVSPSDTICQYNGATFTANPTYGGTSPVLKWIVNGSGVGSGDVFTYVPTTDDTVYCQMISNYQCAITDSVVSNTIDMVVQPLTIPHIAINAYPGIVVDSGKADTLVATAIDAGLHPTYQWYINGVPVSGATTNTFIKVFENYDSVSCAVTSSGVCSAISAYEWVFITYTPKPLGVTTSSTAVSDIRLMPNPNTGAFTVRGTLGTITDEAVTLEITDMLGHILYRNQTTAIGGRVNEQIQNGNMASGMYILNLRTASESKSFHFVVE